MYSLLIIYKIEANQTEPLHFVRTAQNGAVHSLGMNQIQFGRKLFVSKQCISNRENSYILPSIETLAKIAETFSVSTDHLLGLSDKLTLDVTGLSSEQVLHLQSVVNDLKAASDIKKAD